MRRAIKRAPSSGGLEIGERSGGGGGIEGCAGAAAA